MSEDSLLELKERFYDRLYRNVLENDKGFKENNSIFKRFLDMNKNSVLEHLDNSSISSDEVIPLLLNELIEEGLIRVGKEFSNYVITAKGVWEVEKNLEMIDFPKLLDGIDKKYNVKWGVKLSDKEKIVILTLIALRAFYEKTPFNRNNGDEFIRNAKEIIEMVHIFLSENIDKFNHDLKSKSKSKRRENLVNAIFARLDQLPGKTRGLYKFDNNKCCWLNIYSDNENLISEEKLGYLLWKIFGGNLSIEKQNAISNFCNEILLRYKNYIYNSEEIKSFIFSDIIHQNAISNSLFLIVERRVIWGEMDKEK